jgi:hypothetical protein
MLQCFAFQVFHGDEARFVAFADLINSADVGMIQRRGCSCFPAEALQRSYVLRNAIRQEFQRDKPPQRKVFGLVHHPHTATTELFDNPVVRNCLADH